MDYLEDNMEQELSEELLDEIVEIEQVEEKKRKTTVSAVRLSGITANNKILFRGNKKYKFRLVPVDSWNGGTEQKFDENDFSDFDKPAFYKGQ